MLHSFNKEEQALFVQFVTGSSKVPLDGFKALQGQSGPQMFSIQKAYGSLEQLPTAHTCFNQVMHLIISVRSLCVIYYVYSWICPAMRARQYWQASC